MTTRLSARLIIVATLWIPASLTIAADYAADFSVNAGSSYNDNIRLVERDKTSVQKYEVSPKLSLNATTEVSNLDVSSVLYFNRYDKNEFDSDDQNVTIDASHQFENGSLGLNAAYINNSTITSEVLTTGRVGNNAERAQQYQLAPQWVYVINEINSMRIQGNYTVQNYRAESYIGYKNIGAAIDWIHAINERLKWVSAIIYSDYESDDIPFTTALGRQAYSTRTKDKGIQVGLDYQWTERSLLQAKVGRSKTDLTHPINDIDNICSNPAYVQLPPQIQALTGAICSPLPRSEETSSTAELNWSWSTERQKFNLEGTKATQPTGNGYAVDSTRLASGWSYQLSERDQLSANLSLVRNRAIDKENSLLNTSTAERDYYSATLAYQRQLDEHWLLRASYQFSEQKYVDVDYQANGKVFTLSINYHPQSWHWSR